MIKYIVVLKSGAKVVVPQLVVNILQGSMVNPRQVLRTKDRDVRYFFDVKDISCIYPEKLEDFEMEDEAKPTGRT